MGPVSTVLVGSRLPLSWANRRLLAACLRAGARGHASRAGSEPAICSTTTPFDAALAAFEAHGREHLQGTVLVCDGTYLATALCRSSGAQGGSVTEAIQGQFVHVISRIRDLTSARAVVTVFDSGVRKPPVAGSPEARRTLRIVSAEPGAPVWWAQRGSPGLLSRASTNAGFSPLVADPWLEADDVAMSVAVRLHHRGQSALLVSGDSDFQHALRPGTLGADLTDQTGAVSWLRVAQYASKLHPVAEVVTWQGFVDKNGFPPILYADLLALIGRPRGGVLGVRGVGDRAARGLLRRFGPLESVFAAAEAGKTRGAWVAEVTAALTRPGERERALRDRDALMPEFEAAPAERIDTLLREGGRDNARAAGAAGSADVQQRVIVTTSRAAAAAAAAAAANG